MKLNRLVVVAAVASALSMLTALDAASVPTYEIDSDFDGRAELRIFDTDFDGYYEWPAGSRSFNGDLFVDVPVVMVGDVSLKSKGAVGFERMVTFPGVPMRSLTMESREGTIIAAADITATFDIRLTGGFYVALFEEVRFHAEDELVVTARDGSVDISGLFNAPPDDWTLSGGTSITLSGKGREGGINLFDARVRSRKITIDVPNGFNESFRRVSMFGATATTDPVRTGLPGNPGDIYIRGAGEVEGIVESDIDSGRNVIVKTVNSASAFCVESGRVDANNGAGTIDIAGVRRGLEFFAEAFAGPTVVTGRLIGSSKAGVC
jgi:hypothetical protein